MLDPKRDWERAQPAPPVFTPEDLAWLAKLHITEPLKAKPGQL